MNFPCWWPPARLVSLADRSVLLWCPHGELDIAAKPMLQAYCDAELVESDVVVDLAGATFLSAAGITVLVRLAATLTGQGHRLVIADGSGPVARVLRLADVTGQLDIRPTLDAAFAGLAAVQAS